MSEPKQRQEYFSKVPEAMQAMVTFNKAVEASGLEHSLIHLVKIRSSQINGCSYCVHMHNYEALADGETQQRLFMVAAWRESPLFTERERVAFEWAEAVTQISHGGVSDDLYARAREQFSEEDLARLTLVICAINVWNRLSVSFHTIHPMNPPKIKQ